MADSVEPVSLTERGRAIVSRIAHCYVEVSYGGEYDSKGACRTIAQSSKLPLVGSGTGRDVFAVDAELVAGETPCVVKMAKNLEGGYETRREIETIDRFSESVQQHLTPIFEYDIGWVLMPRADIDVTDEEVEQLQVALTDAGVMCRDADVAHNVGKLGGTPVVIDYGKGCYEYSQAEFSA